MRVRDTFSSSFHELAFPGGKAGVVGLAGGVEEGVNAVAVQKRSTKCTTYSREEILFFSCSNLRFSTTAANAHSPDSGTPK